MHLEFHNPSGLTEVSLAHAPRLSTLDGKRIGFLSNGDWQSFRSLPMLHQMLQADFPGAQVLPLDSYPEGTAVISLDTTIDAIAASGVDAVILGNAACGACSTACAVAAGKLEARGIATVLVTREEFADVVRNAASGLGLPADMPMVTFPIDLFIPDSDLAPMVARRSEIYARLTGWEPELGYGDGPAMITVEGRDQSEALRKANNLFMLSGWGDGLPLWPATAEAVDWMLQGTDLPREHLLGKFPPRGGFATVEACAVALAMAGGRPEYLPVLIAAVEGLLDPLANGEQMQATSGGTFPVIIVNGPYAQQIRLNSDFGCLGPDPRAGAGASIGRALRQMQQNLGGARPGLGTMAPWGAMRFTNAVFAEDEGGLPDGWSPHGTTRHGYAPGTNSISFFWATGATNVMRRSAQSETLEEDALQGLHRMADYIGVPNMHYVLGYDEGAPGAFLLTRVVANYLASTGWTQAAVRQFLFDHSRIAQDKLRRNGVLQWIERRGGAAAKANAAHDSWPISARPENIILAVAGGAHPTHAFWFQAWAEHVIGKEIRVPAGHGALLKAADRELGCGADVCKI